MNFADWSVASLHNDKHKEVIVFTTYVSIILINFWMFPLFRYGSKCDWLLWDVALQIVFDITIEVVLYWYDTCQYPYPGYVERGTLW